MSAADGRYAPSPTGPLHLGNLRTALLAWCFARSCSGRFVLRIEDLDPQRSRREHEPGILADLTRLGIDWDGAPARQSERLEHHRNAFERLRASGRLYRCWCTRAEIRQAAQAPQGAAAEGVYPGTCRGLSARAQRARSVTPAAWRLDAQAERVEFDDRLAGKTAAPVDDCVVWRDADPTGRTARSREPGRSGGRQADGVPAYNLAVVVDDAAAGVGEVVRGDDLLETTPRQILLAQLLGLPVPRYAHVPLVLGADGQRLAKRQSPARAANPLGGPAPAGGRHAGSAVTLDERLALGESIERVVGWMAASAGLARAGSELNAREVLAVFDPTRLRREPAVLD